MNRCLMPTIALAAIFVGAPLVQAAEPPAAASGHYSAVGGHTQVVFDIMHMGISPFYGSFGKVTGTLQFDAKEPAKSSVTVDVDADSLYTPSSRLNDDLKSADVFDVAAFPTATFTSTAIKKTGANTGDITGNLTLHGVTKPVTLHATFFGAKQSMSGAGYRLGFGATGRLKRSDFGLTAMRWAPMVADDIDLMIEAEFVQDTK
jgi:polyisoprenoid-binding protein YceI